VVPTATALITANACCHSSYRYANLPRRQSEGSCDQSDKEGPISPEPLW